MMRFFVNIKNYFLENYEQRQFFYMLLFYPLILIFIGEFNFNGFSASVLMFFAFLIFSIVWMPKINSSLLKFGLSERSRAFVFPAFVLMSIFAFHSKEDVSNLKTTAYVFSISSIGILLWGRKDDEPTEGPSSEDNEE